MLLPSRAGRWSRALVAGFLVTLSADAHAEEAAASAVPERRRWLFLEGAAGLGAPLGFAGGSVLLRPVTLVAMHVGTGFGAQGMQLAAGARFTVKVRSTSFGLGVGVSTGPFAGLDEGAYVVGVPTRPRTFVWDRAQFLNFDLSYERERSREARVALRPFVGLGYVLNDDATHVGGHGRPIDRGGPVQARFVPYIGVALALGIL